MSHSRAISLAVFSICWMSALCPARADDDLHRFFSQLRSRYLFELAEGECIRRLTGQKPQTTEYAEYTLELSRTYSEHAKYVSGEEQKELWNQSRTILQDLWKRVPDHPYLLELKKESALSFCEEAHYLRWMAQIRFYDEQFRQQTLRSIETAIEKTRALEQRFNRSEQSRNRKSRESVSPVRMRQLLNEIRFLYARTILDRLYLLKSDHPDRHPYLKQAMILVETITDSSPHDDLKWKTQVLQIDLFTQAGLFDEVEKIFAHPSFLKTSAQNPDAFLAGRVRYLHTRKEYSRASQELAEHFLKNENISGELYFVGILNKTTLWEQALRDHDAKAARLSIERIDELAKRCQQDIGGYWSFRCVALQQNTESVQRYGPNLAPAVLKAESLYSSNRLLASATEYKSAFRLASRENRNVAASEFLYLSASLFVQAGQFEAARTTLEDFLLKYPAHKNRPQAHLLYAYCLGHIYAKDATQKNLTRYTQTLEEHRGDFKTHDTFVEATWMLAQLEEQRQQIYSKALNLYREIPVTHPRYPESQVAVARCYESILVRLRKTNRPTREWETYAIDQLTSYLRDFSADAVLSSHQAEVLVRLSRILLNKPQPNYRTSEQYLKRVFDSWEKRQTKLKNNNDPQAKRTLQQWTNLMNAATQFRIISLAGSDHLDRAKQLMDRISKIETKNALAILDGLTNLNTGGTVDFRYKLGRLQLIAAEKLESRRKDLSAVQEQKLDRCLAQAHLAMNKPMKAIAIYEKIYGSHPGDDRLLRKLADLLFDCKTDDCQRRASVYWKKIGSQEKQGSDAWLEARYRIALCQFNLKNYSECRKLLAVVKLLYPNAGSKDLREKIQILFASAKRFEKR